jgi:hypothetical protein
MKKSLLATTALAALGAVAVAGSASAAERISIGVGGYMEQWFGYVDNDDSVVGNRDGFNNVSDGEIHFTGETTLDNGLTFGVNVQLEAQTEGDQIDEQYAYIEGSFGRFLIGSENSAAYLMHYGIPSFGVGNDSGDHTNWIAGMDFTGHRTNGRGPDNDSEKITYFTPRFYGFQVGASYVPELAQDADAPPRGVAGARNDAFAVAANFNRSFNDFTLRASAGYMDFGEHVGPDVESYQFGLQLGYAGFTLAGTYGEEDRVNAAQVFTDTQETYGVAVTYATGPFGVSLNWIGSERDGPGVDIDQDAFELGGRYTLGPGVEARGSLLYGEREAAVDLAEGFAVVGGIRLVF